MEPAHAASSASGVEDEVLRVRRLMDMSDHGAALAAAQALLERVPLNRDVLYMVAANQRYLKSAQEALATLDRLEAAHPRYSRLFQERGHCFIALRDPASALDAYLQAVNLNAALPASWKALHVLFRSSGRMGEAEAAAGHVTKLATLPAAVVAASSLFADGEVHEAERIVRRFLQTNATDVEGMRLLARIGVKLDVLDDAEFLLESVLLLSPSYHLARYDYVCVLLKRHQHQRAYDESDILVRADPANRDYRAVYAAACLSLGKYDEALRVYHDLVVETPGSGDLHLSIGHALKTLGRQRDAIESYRAAAKAEPSFGDAYWSLANLKTYRFEDGEIERMQAEEADTAIRPVDRYHLCFALGKALEDRRDYVTSFSYYARGNMLKRSETGYQAEVMQEALERQKQLFTRAFLAARAGLGCDRPDPIFIVGLPRAGSTLIEQILASHPQVDGTMELADISRLAVRLQGRSSDGSSEYSTTVAALTAGQLCELGSKYIADTGVYRTGRRFFIDKNPNNFRHLGLIHLILPNAKFIDARREAMACCFSNFKQLFASGQEFTYDLTDIALYYRGYLDLMDHWDLVLPGRVLRVQHEDVVADLASSVERILEFCQLPFDERCIDFHKTDRSVRTASSEQVRRPIFRDGIDQWQNFSPWLGPLREALAPDAG